MPSFMKKILLSVLFALFTAATFSQQISSTARIDVTDYLQKSRHQKTAAWILLGGGVAMVSSSLIVGLNEVANSSFFFDANVTGSAILFVGGIVAAAASIPFFISSAKNKRRAMSLSFKAEKSLILTSRGFGNTSFPALSLKVNL